MTYEKIVRDNGFLPKSQVKNFQKPDELLRGVVSQKITTTRIAGGLLLGYNPNYTCPGLKSFALHFVQVTIAM